MSETHTMRYRGRFQLHFSYTRHGLRCRYCGALLDPVDRLGRWNYFRVQGHLGTHMKSAQDAIKAGAK